MKHGSSNGRRRFGWTVLASSLTVLLATPAQPQDTELVSIPCPKDPLVENFAFGAYVSLSGDWLFVADPSAHDTGFTVSGAVYAFRRSGARWSLRQTLTGVDTSNFGGQVATDGETLAVGAPSWFRSGGSKGRVDLFRRDGDSWHLDQQLYPSGFSCDDAFFGQVLALSGDVLAVRLNDCPADPYKRQIRIYERSQGQWQQTGRFRTRPTAQHAWVGWGLAAQDDLIVVGLDGFFGSAVVLRKGAEGWFRSAWLSDPTSVRGDDLGRSAAIDGDTIVLGAPAASAFPPRGGGAVVFERTGLDQWALAARLRPSDPFAGVDFGDGFGHSVAIEGDDVVVGANHGRTAGFNTGTVYSFRKGTNGWPATETESFVSSTPLPGDWLGASVDVEGGLVVSGVLGLNGQAVSSALLFGEQRGAMFCDAVANSTGLPAELSIHGNDVADHDGPALYRVRHLPPVVAGGLALSLQRRAPRPVFNGNLCLGPSIRLVGPPSSSDLQGEVLEEVATGDQAGWWVAGTTLYVQYWYADTGGLGFSDAVELTLR